MSKKQTNYLTNGQSFGFWTCLAFVIGSVIGSGIFLVPASLAPYGGISLIGWLVTAIGAFFTTKVFMYLSQTQAGLGGPYYYAKRNFGAGTGFFVVWSYWISIICANAAIAVAAVAYLGYFFPQLNQNSLLAALSSLSIIWLLTWLNIKSSHLSGRFQLIATLIKLLPLIVIGVALLFYFDAQSYTPFNPSELPALDAINTCAAITLWAFLGIEAASVPTGYIKNPKKTITLATIVGFVVITLVYISSQMSITSVIPFQQLAQSTAPYADAAKVMWGDFAGELVAVGAIISCVGALNGWILIQGQLPMSAAKDGVMPSFFDADKQKAIPIKGILFSSLVVSIITIANFNKGLIGLFTFAILVSTFSIFVPYLVSIFAVIKSIWNEGTAKQNKLNLCFAVLALVYMVWAISGIGYDSFIWGVFLLLVGIPVYLWQRSSKN